MDMDMGWGRARRLMWSFKVDFGCVRCICSLGFKVFDGYRILEIETLGVLFQFTLGS